MISGHTKLIAHLGYPTTSFKAPLIYNPYFESRGIDAVVLKPKDRKPNIRARGYGENFATDRRGAWTH